MIDVLNLMGASIASFGNHEFDFDQRFTVLDLVELLKRSKFICLPSNIAPSDRADQAAHDAWILKDRFQDAVAIQLTDRHSVFIFGLLYPYEIRDVGTSGDPIERCRRLIELAKNDFISRFGVFRPSMVTFVALTHQHMTDDERLARECPDLRLIIGGHDHDIREARVINGCIIVKAASNARTLRLNAIAWLPQRAATKDAIEVVAKTVSERITSSLVGTSQRERDLARSEPAVVEFLERFSAGQLVDKGKIICHAYKDDGAAVIMSIAIDTLHPGFRQLVPLDPHVRKRILKWLADSPEHSEQLLSSPADLFTSDEDMRSRSTNAGNFIADVVRARSNQRRAERVIADVGLVNGGSCRLGRNIPKGEMITAATLCDMLYHPNQIVVYRSSLRTLREIVRRSLEMRANGNFLQISGMTVRVPENENGEFEIQIPAREGADSRGDNFLLATTTYVAEHPDAYREQFGQLEKLQDYEPSIHKAVVAELRAGSFSPPSEPRWKFEDDARRAPAVHD